jgi:hypothetical protein
MKSILKFLKEFFLSSHPTCRFCGGVELADPDVDVCRYCEKEF